jgi:hypothetical protein
MAKIVDITDKLNFEEKPKIVIKGVEIEVSNKAVDVLKITPTLQKEKLDPKDIYSLYQVLFPEESREKIEAFGLDFNDFSTVILQAATVIASGDNEGEAQTPTTT